MLVVFGLVVSTCQVIGYRKTPLHVVRLSPQSPDGRTCLCVFFFCLFCLCFSVFLPGPTHYILHMPMARYSLYVLTVPLSTKQTDKQLSPTLSSMTFDVDTDTTAPMLRTAHATVARVMVFFVFSVKYPVL